MKPGQTAILSNDMDLSIVIPVYNSQDCLAELVKRITTVLGPAGRSFEIILVNDGSTDKSWEVIRTCAAAQHVVRGVSLRRNFGQDGALMAGLNQMQGRYAVIMDDDLQHDPRYILFLLAEIEKGFDVVYAKYSQKRQAWWKNAGSSFNDKAATFLLKKPAHVYLSPYKIIAAPVVKEICKYQGAYPYVDGLLFRVTSHFSQILIEHQKRFSGKSHFTLIKSILVWSNLVTNFSVLPLRFATIVGLCTAAGGIFMAFIMVIQRLINPDWPEGQASIIVSVLTLGGIQLFAIGVLGEYIGRTYLNINRQPQFVIAEKTDNATES
jgi:polyisoprenyl-phosphate glycosyltransferase